MDNPLWASGPEIPRLTPAETAELGLTFGDLLLNREHDDHPGLRFEDSTWTWAEVVRECAARAAVLTALRRPDRPFHLGVLLENVPEYIFLLGAAALSGATLIGINPTRRGAELAADIRGVDCDLILTDTAQCAPLAGLDTGVDPDRILAIDESDWQKRVSAESTHPVRIAPAARDRSTRLLLTFTSGSTGAPKAVICTTGRLAALGAANHASLTRADVTYNAMPLFHGNAIMACWAPSVFTGATFTMRRRFSVSGFLPDVRRFGATYFNYVGRSLAYLLSAPESPLERDTKLRTAFGTEAAPRDRAEFARRFGVRPVESYGSSEGGVVIRLTDDSPPGALGRAPDFMRVAIHDEHGNECPRAVFDSNGALLNAAEAIGEIVNRTGAVMFEGYYRNAEASAERVDGAIFRSGDLGYRDAEDFFYFAGRSGDRIRVDSENFATAPVERILARFPGVKLAAVYPVPDPRTGDQVMATLELDAGVVFDPELFGRFLAAQPDLGTKWAPRFVRITESIPVTATRKIDKPSLRRASWLTEDPVYLGNTKNLAYRAATPELRAELLREYAEYGRSPH
ncbi:AMP-binding protein [Nocardia sp. SYP-A9097]|uniref:AMP-binding protein n=1 Tax=Nocardia sp. SYP-A9097 TaxID=2663237 RepID=UPI00129BBF72|nr:AMP-binding protein [Nocardia sp. SYP-A9097]MRH91411.1 AMP-binding protein [Nocardia sp. SYP-A9097]